MAEVMILAGGTGGHVFPALAVAVWLREHGHQVSWMGTSRGLEARVVPAAGFELDTAAVSGLRRTGLKAKLQAPWMLARALIQAGRYLRRRRPSVVLGMGGFVAGPGGLMAGWLGIPLVLHEQNRIPGTTNRWLAPRARRVLEGFPGTFPDRFWPCWTGNPLRAEIVGRSVDKAPLEGRPVRLLVMGGSQGAQILNETVPEALAGLANTELEVWHQSGGVMASQVAEAYRKNKVSARVEAFIDDMATAYAWADLVIARAGAMTVSELAAVGVGAILVPYPYAIDDHQRLNAQYLVEREAAVMLLQSELTPRSLRQAVTACLARPERLRAMGAAARKAARLDATETVARICLEEAESGAPVKNGK
ncbi:MAG: undecaprenyldiphospho-muramoylpentapeptide beta-N-acetylglucosaminyltransferase [Methylohalobius crimeensis]